MNTQKTIKLSDIARAIASLPMDEARAQFADAPQLEITGQILKVVSREPGVIRLYVQTDEQPQPRQVFALFTSLIEQGKFAAKGIKKNFVVTITGTLRSFGETAVCLSDCKLISEKPPVKKATKAQVISLAKTGKPKRPQAAQETAKRLTEVENKKPVTQS